ncbi:hypothetical protein pb186bvf_009754 [Paramecium bursaria]
MPNLILDNTQQPQITKDLVVINDSQLLSLFGEQSFDEFHVDQVNFDIAYYASKIIKLNGLLYTKEDNKDLLEASGLYFYRKDESYIYQRRSFQEQRIVKQEQIQNAFGYYDYIEQKYINNAFQMVNEKEQQETIDEDELLNDGVQVKQIESCATKPRACTNCTCGRKELEDAQDKDQLLKQLETGKVESSCGSCYLGDAFRCANCPYRGLPAFKQGEIIQVKKDDQINDQVEAPQIQESQGVVKIKL